MMFLLLFAFINFAHSIDVEYNDINDYDIDEFDIDDYDIAEHDIDIDDYDIDDCDINIISYNESNYDIVAFFHTRIYKTTINQNVINTMQPIFRAYPNMLRNILEQHIYSDNNNSDFFDMEYEPNKIILSFLLDLDYVKETVVIELFEFTQKTFEQKIEEKLDYVEEYLDVRIAKNIPKRYYLQRVEYDVNDDEIMNTFKWDLANQSEKEKFREVAKKYILHGRQYYRIEPLVLEVHNNKCHLYGWIDVRNIPVKIPDDLNVTNGHNRILTLEKNVGPNNSHDLVAIRLVNNYIMVDTNKGGRGIFTKYDPIHNGMCTHESNIFSFRYEYNNENIKYASTMIFKTVDVVFICDTTNDPQD